jgi:hypothetical protein
MDANQSIPRASKKFQSNGVKALMTCLPDGYSYSPKTDCLVCEYSEHRKPVILISMNHCATTATSSQFVMSWPFPVAR